jgi:L-lactate utilization protein LutB
MSTAADLALPFASTLCAACYDVCPVAINISEALVHLRAPARSIRSRTLVFIPNGWRWA